MFAKHTTEGFRQLLPGITMRTLVYGEKSLLSEFHLQGGSHLPLHTHPNEQTGYLISGRIRFLGEDGSVVFDASPGDAWTFPMNLPHAADILEDSVAIEVFSPVREDYLPSKA